MNTSMRTRHIPRIREIWIEMGLLFVGSTIGPAIRLLKLGFKAYSRYTKYERKAFNFAYKGYRPGIRRGAVHGHVIGSTFGGLAAEYIGSAQPETDKVGERRNNIQQPRKRRFNRSYNSYSKRGRYPDYCRPSRDRRYHKMGFL